MVSVEAVKFVEKVGEFDLITAELEGQGKTEEAERRWGLSTRWFDREARRVSPDTVVTAGFHFMMMKPNEDIADVLPYLRHTGLSLLSGEIATAALAPNHNLRWVLRDNYAAIVEDARLFPPEPNSVQLRNVNLAVRGLRNLQAKTLLTDGLLSHNIANFLLEGIPTAAVTAG